MNHFELNLELTTPVYVPILSNKVQYAISVDDDELYPYHISGIGFVNNQGKLHYQENSVAFPYTQEWYDKLKVVYPDLEPYKDEVDYNKLTSLLLNQLDKICTTCSDTSYQDAIKDSDKRMRDYSERNCWKYTVPLNPYTFKPCKTIEEYFQVPDLEIPF